MARYDENEKAAVDPATIDALELVDHLCLQATKHREVCANMIKITKEKLEFWVNQHAVITNFLSQDQLNEDVPQLEDKIAYEPGEGRSRGF